ncbi:MAG TPA: phosphatidylglycerophosphatase A [Flavisolibacter sp.]|jgi:phosphatidylglycerophosphatase A|nr:phosphatidylglycerophosphatase A [Flavisolibacter sp.]
MIVLYKIIATILGIGYIQKGAGTIAAFFCCLAWLFLKAGTSIWWMQLLVLTIIFFIGVFVSAQVEKEWGHDSNRVVIDELQGMMTALFLMPNDWRYLLVAFVLFRFFDIAKPLGIRRMEAFAGGWGVMLDDLLAGIYSNVLLQVIVKSHLFS